MYDTPLTFLRDQNAPASALLAVALGKYGFDCATWEPEVLRLELEEDFNIKLSDLQADRLQAAILILTTDQFESNWHAFSVCCQLLSGEHADHTSFEPLEAEQLIGALPEIEFMRNDDEDGITWSPEVRAYAGLVFYEYGCSKAPILFPTAIMPEHVVEGDMIEKNLALEELYKAKKEYLEKYLVRVKAAYSY